MTAERDTELQRMQREEIEMKFELTEQEKKKIEAIREFLEKELNK